MSFRINYVNRRVSPCKGCAREWKRPGCHDSCPDFAVWKAENEEAARAREAYNRQRYHS